MEVITSKKCSLCLDVLPMGSFRFISSRMLYAARCRHCEADEAVARNRRRGIKPPPRKWTPEELEVLRRVYPEGGSPAVAKLLPDRTLTQIQSRAKDNKIPYTGPTLGGSPPKDDEPWGVPVHEYCEADVALRGWRASMPVIGVFGPSVGLVVGVAA
jgi:hypothetical protein